MESRPLVSVIVPNYMHAVYLDKRLQSIADQTFTDFEVIMLDDASTDGSIDTLRAWEAKDARFRFIPNDVNSGSTFHQWNKGVSEAQGDYLWIAESDDWADPRLLEYLVPLMDNNPGVGIAFGQSMLVNAAGVEMHSFDVNYRYIFKHDRWTRPYLNDGRDEIRNYMMLHNIVPNASGALMRKSMYDAIGGADPDWKLNGDWMFYIRMLEVGDIAYTPEILNYFRLHQQTQRIKANASGHVYTELLRIVDYIRDHHAPEPKVRRKAYRNIASWWTHSLYRQQWGTTGNARINWQLFQRFLSVHPLVLLHIPYEGLVRIAVRALELMGLKEPIRRILHYVFPTRFMPKSQ